MISRTRRMVGSAGSFFSANQRSTSGLVFIPATLPPSDHNRLGASYVSRSMSRLAIVGLVVLAGCSGPSTAKPSPSPAASASPVAISTACPPAGKAAAAVLTPVTLGNHPTIIYSDEPTANGGPVVSSLVRYDVTTAAKAEILKTTVSEAEVSPDGHWIALATLVSGQPAVQLVRTDGQYLQTVFCGEPNGSIRGILWSSDLKSLLFSPRRGSGPAPIYRLDLNKATLAPALRNNSLSTDYAPLSWVDANRLLLLGRPIGPAPVSDPRLL